MASGFLKLKVEMSLFFLMTLLVLSSHLRESVCVCVCVCVLQVICFNSVCHPHWQRPPLWDLRRDGGNGYNWTECHAVHIPAPKPAASFQSLAALRNSSDMYAHIGRWVLDRSGRSRLLEQP